MWTECVPYLSDTRAWFFPNPWAHSRSRLVSMIEVRACIYTDLVFLESPYNILQVLISLRIRGTVHIGIIRDILNRSLFVHAFTHEFYPFKICFRSFARHDILSFVDVDVRDEILCH